MTSCLSRVGLGGLLGNLFGDKPYPKQEHPSVFEVVEDGPYTACAECDAWQETVPKVKVEVFYEREKDHVHFLSALGKYSSANRRYITKCIGLWADGKPIQQGVTQ